MSSFRQESRYEAARCTCYTLQNFKAGNVLGFVATYQQGEGKRESLTLGTPLIRKLATKEATSGINFSFRGSAATLFF